MSSVVMNQHTELTERREQLTQVQNKHNGLQGRLNQLRSQQEAIKKTIESLEQERVSLVGKIASGAGKDSDLVKLRKTINAARDEFIDTNDVYQATEKAHTEALQEVDKARTAFQNAELRAWREVHRTLIERHKATVQEIATWLYAAGLQCQPGLGELQFWSVLNALDLKKPNLEEITRIKTELQEEFSLS